MADVLSVDEHLARVLAAVSELPTGAVPVLEAVGLVCAADVVSPVALPSFDNSAMDGYAVVAADLEGASETAPVTLPVVGEIGAGQVGVRELAAGVAAKIMTGGPIPSGADAVVPYEWTDRGVDRVVVTQAPAVGAHVRPTGDDVGVGELLVAAGTRLGPRHAGLLASVGRAEVEVVRRPRVAVISTGSELTPPGQALGPDTIYDGNSFLLAAAVEAAGATPVRVGVVPDRVETFLATLDALLPDVDAVVTSGGVSQGDFDVVKAALAPRGVWFGPVAMQPGKPQGFGLLEGVPVFTLPGNPVSSYLSFETFVHPALRTMMGIGPAVRPVVTAAVTGGFRSPAGRRQLVRAAWGADGVTPVGGHGSHLVGDLSRADALIVVPEDVTEVAAGDTVSVVRLDLPF